MTRPWIHSWNPLSLNLSPQRFLPGTPEQVAELGKVNQELRFGGDKAGESLLPGFTLSLKRIFSERKGD